MSFLGYLRIKLKQQLFDITHIRALNTWSNQTPFSQLYLRNACRNENTQCNFMNIWLAQNLGLLQISFYFFWNIFFGSLKLGNYKISWMCSLVKSDHFFSVWPNFWLTELFNLKKHNPEELNAKVPDQSDSQSHTYISENNLTKLKI